MLILLSSILVIVLAVIIFFQTAPQIGKLAEGERLERMKAAENYEDGVFKNTIHTAMDMPFSTLRNVMKERFFGDQKSREPQEEIKTIPFDSESFTSFGPDTVAVTWFGHSSLLIRINAVTILVDPVLVGKRASMFTFIGPRRFRYSNQVELAQLPEIDLVLLSHDHYDHLDYPTIKALGSSVKKFYMPLGLGAHLEHWGIESGRIVEMNWWDELVVDGLKLALTPTRHFSGRAFRDRFKTLWGSWVIASNEHRLYFSGDSGYFPGFKEIGDKYGPFDLTFMECGAYNEGWSEIHMFPEETAQAHLDLNGRFLMPIHWGKFDLALHPWKESVQRLTKKAQEEQIELVTPEVGQVFILPKNASFGPWWKQYE